MRCACCRGARIRLRQPRAGNTQRDGGFRVFRRVGRSPVVGGPAGDDADVIARLFRQRPPARKPRAYPPRSGIVAGGGEAEIAELFAQFAQIARRMAQRLDRIERIGEPVPIGGLRHELGDAFGALVADRAGVKAALLPDHAGEEFDRKLVLRRVLFDRAADIIGGRRRFGRGGLIGRVRRQGRCCAGLRMRIRA